MSLGSMFWKKNFFGNKGHFFSLTSDLRNLIWFSDKKKQNKSVLLIEEIFDISIKIKKNYKFCKQDVPLYQLELYMADEREVKLLSLSEQLIEDWAFGIRLLQTTRRSRIKETIHRKDDPFDIHEENPSSFKKSMNTDTRSSLSVKGPLVHIPCSFCSKLSNSIRQRGGDKTIPFGKFDDFCICEWIEVHENGWVFDKSVGPVRQQFFPFVVQVGEKAFKKAYIGWNRGSSDGGFGTDMKSQSSGSSREQLLQRMGGVERDCVFNCYFMYGSMMEMRREIKGLEDVEKMMVVFKKMARVGRVDAVDFYFNMFGAYARSFKEKYRVLFRDCK